LRGGLPEQYRRCFEQLREPTSRRDIVYIILQLVPLGAAVTYGVLAALAGTSPRTIGAYMRSNRCLVLIPCHRVAARRGIGGFSKGVEFKLRLLRLEGWSGEKIDSVSDFWRVVEEEGQDVELSGCDDDLWG